MVRSSTIVIAALIFLLALLQYKLWFSPDSITQFWKLKSTIAVVHQENDVLQARNDHMAADVKDLKQGDEAVEERARNELGLVKPNEVFYQIVQ